MLEKFNSVTRAVNVGYAQNTFLFQKLCVIYSVGYYVIGVLLFYW